MGALIRVLLLLLAGETRQPRAQEHGHGRPRPRAVVGPSDLARTELKLSRAVVAGLLHLFTVPSQRIQRTSGSYEQPSHELYPSCHSPDGARDQIRNTASHERGEGHEEEQTAAHARHHRADPPLQAGDAVEGGVPPALLQHHRGLPLLVPHGVGAPAERPERHRFVHLRAQEPIGHEEAHAGGGGAQQRQQSPDHARAGQAGRHGARWGQRLANEKVEMENDNP